MHPHYVISSEVSQQLNAGILRILADDQWHPLHQFLPLGDLIEPEVAARLYTSKSGITSRSLDEQVRGGRRFALEGRLKTQVSRGTVECQGHGFNKTYRRVLVRDPVEVATDGIKKVLAGIPENAKKGFLSRLAARIVEIC